MLKETAEILTGEKFCFYVHEQKRNLFKKEIVKHEFEISALNLFTMIRISKEVLTIDKEIFNKKLVNASIETLAKHGETFIKIIAYAVLNDKRIPDKNLLSTLSLIRSEDVLEIVSSILKQMRLQDFMISIISISGANVMEMNPKEQRS